MKHTNTIAGYGFVAALAVALMVVPSTAWACAVCFDPREGIRWAFIATTGVLSLAPLFMVGGIAYWIRKKVDEAEAQSRQEMSSTGS